MNLQQVWLTALKGLPFVLAIGAFIAWYFTRSDEFREKVDEIGVYLLIGLSILGIAALLAILIGMIFCKGLCSLG